MGDARIRPANAADFAAIGQLQAAIFPDAWGVAAVAKLLEDAHGFGFLAFADGPDAPGSPGPAGFAICRAAGGEGEVLSLGVCAHARQRGLAGGLLEASAETARLRGADALYLEVAVGNGDALLLYQRHGFDAVGARAGYYRAPGVAATDARVLRRAL